MAEPANNVSMIKPPSTAHSAEFAAGFGQRVLLTVDTEEEFNWNAPFTRDQHGLEHIAAIVRFQRFCEEIGAHPVYLVDWPVANDDHAVEIIGDAVMRGKAEIGVQLHPWVNPPFDEDVTAQNSYAGNLPRELERAKLSALRDRIEHAFGTAPLIYRAGRYGLGPNSADILHENGIKIDTSVRSLFDYTAQHGPDYSDHPLAPYWIEGLGTGTGAERQDLLELPITSVYSGLLRQWGRRLHRAERHIPALFSGFSRLNLLERIALTPEGVSGYEAIRGIDIAIDEKLPVLVLSFHSPSLAPGFTPYVADQNDVETLYNWLRTIYAHLDRRGVRSTKVSEIVQAAQR